MTDSSGTTEARVGAGRAGSGRLGAILWALCWQYFVGEQVARLGWRTPYSFKTNYISDLGAMTCGMRDATRYVCSPWHAVMNTSFLLQGLLIVVGAVLVRKLLPPGWLATVGVGLIAVGGLGVLAVGLFPEDVNLAAHILGAQAHFFGGNVGMILLGLAFLWRTGGKVVGGWTVAAGVIGLVATLLFPAGHFFGLGVGGMERVAAYPLPIWLTGAGVWLLRNTMLPIKEPS